MRGYTVKLKWVCSLKKIKEKKRPYSPKYCSPKLNKQSIFTQLMLFPTKCSLESRGVTYLPEQVWVNRDPVLNMTFF